MNCEKTREYMIELIDGRLAGPAGDEVRAHLEACPACRAELGELRETLAALDRLPAPEPSPRLRERVLAAVEREKRSLHSAPTPAPLTRRRSWLFPATQALAACGLLALGFFIGTRRAPPGADLATQRELADLRSRVDSMGQLVGYSILQQQDRSSNDRLEGVLASAAVRKPGDTVINGLITSLALDPSVNVRLNALQALYAHRDKEVVRTSVLVSLPRETSPLVQLAMIDFLAATRDRGAAPALQRLSAADGIDHNVREAAQRALTQL